MKSCMIRRMCSDSSEHIVQFFSVQELIDQLMYLYSELKINSQEWEHYKYFISHNFDSVVINGVVVFEITTIVE